MKKFRLGTRHWDHVLPIALMDTPGADAYELDRFDSTPDLWQKRHILAGETSFSKYVRARAEGDFSVTALPVFLMTGFRHRCIITAKTSDLETAADLKGARIGLTGWADSGNTWTRAILREVGVEIANADWHVGSLTRAHPVMDRIGDVDVPGNVRPSANDEPLVDMLERGALDAVMTPFMPPDFYSVDSPFRPLFTNARGSEADYFSRTGFIPGIHLLGVQTDVLEEEPERAQELTDLFQSAKRLSASRRRKLQDVTPWQNEAVAETIRTFGDDWMPYGWGPNEKMIHSFVEEMQAQHLLRPTLTADELFPFRTETTN